MPKKTLALWESMEARIEQVRSDFEYELAEFKKDMASMEKIVRGKGRNLICSPDDIIHGALLVAENYRMLQELSRIMENAREERDRAEALDFLASHGARVTRKPAGWSHIAPDGRRTHLAAESEPGKAAEKLSALLSAQAEAAKAAPVTSAPAPAKEEPEAPRRGRGRRTARPQPESAGESLNYPVGAEEATAPLGPEPCPPAAPGRKAAPSCPVEGAPEKKPRSAVAKSRSAEPDQAQSITEIVRRTDDQEETPAPRPKRARRASKAKAEKA